LTRGSETTRCAPARAREFDACRPRLLSIAYRMMGGAADAEDIVQEAFVRYSGAADAEIASPKAYLTTIVTRLCIDAKRSARSRREEYVGPWLPEPIADEGAAGAAPDEMLADSIGYAFLLVLEKLGPVERAVFVLHEVFELEYEEIGSIVGKSTANCRQIGARARERVRAGRPRFTVSVEEQQRVAGEFVHACASGDTGRLLRVLAQDAVLYADGGGKAPAFGRIRATTRPMYGRERVARFALTVMAQAPPGFGWRPARLNRQQGILGYLDDCLVCALILGIGAERVRGVYIVVNPDKLERLARGLGGPPSV
jgi:RNA polymerase sigma-70 factor (ECF subfamily)